MLSFAQARSSLSHAVTLAGSTPLVKLKCGHPSSRRLPLRGQAAPLGGLHMKRRWLWITLLRMAPSHGHRHRRTDFAVVVTMRCQIRRRRRLVVSCRLVYGALNGTQAVLHFFKPASPTAQTLVNGRLTFSLRGETEREEGRPMVCCTHDHGRAPTRETCLCGSVPEVEDSCTAAPTCRASHSMWAEA